jgi:hypothetical protein
MGKTVRLSLAAAIIMLTSIADGKSPPAPDSVRAVYLSSDNIYNQKKIAELEKIISQTNANGIVIDFKDSNNPDVNYLAALAKRFKNIGAYTIARIVVFQDSRFARLHPEIAVKTSSGDFWHSGRASWKRYWLDPASLAAQDYNIEIAKRAIDAGFDEIQFDYIRFPTDGNMRDISFPFFNIQKETKVGVLNAFFRKLRAELKSYAPNVILSIDVFGEVFVYGVESSIGQELLSLADNFDVISPMAYPSHYMCGEFGLKDPTVNPYKVYFDTLTKGLAALRAAKKSVLIRPWIQDFSIRSIYNCGPLVVYNKEKVRAQIEAAKDLGINGFMLWNASNKFTVAIFE